MDERTGLCLGCLRTIDEIATWSRMTPQEQRDLWGLIEQRARRTQA